MRCSQIAFALCIFSNFYQSRYIILQLFELCLKLIVLFSMDAQRYIQQQINASREIKICNQTSEKYTLSHYADECPQHRYYVRVIERRPLIIYIEQFLTPNEQQHLIELA